MNIGNYQLRLIVLPSSSQLQAVVNNDMLP